MVASRSGLRHDGEIIDIAQLTDLSHRLERVSLALARDDSDDERVVAYLASLGCGQRESIAMALAYVIRAGDARAITLLQQVLRT